MKILIIKIIIFLIPLTHTQVDKGPEILFLLESQLVQSVPFTHVLQEKWHAAHKATSFLFLPLFRNILFIFWLKIFEFTSVVITYNYQNVN